MNKPADISPKPIVLKTDTGFGYFDYDDIILFRAEGHDVECVVNEDVAPVRVYHSLNFLEKEYCDADFCRCNRATIVNLRYIKRLETKTKNLTLKNNMVLKVSDGFIRLLKTCYNNENDKNTKKKIHHNRKNIILRKFKVVRNRLRFNRIWWIFKKGIRSDKNSITIFLSMSALSIISGCESPERFYRPDLPEQLCVIGIIDVDDTTLRHISFEKSFQSEYPLNNSLGNFSFTISSAEKELLNYHSDITIKGPIEFEIPANIEFQTGEKYSLSAQENSTPQISATTNVPRRPSEPLIISIRYENIVTNPLPCVANIRYKLASIGLSFANDPGQNLYYAILVEGEWLDSWYYWDPHFEARSFEVTGCNATGFFAPVWGYAQFQYHCGEDGIDTAKLPYLTSYFIEGSKIPGNKCIINVSTIFRDYVTGKERKKIRIKVLSIPKDLFVFEKSLYSYARNSSDHFSEPVYLNGNIKGGNGIFSICRSTDIVINVPKPLPLN